MQDAWISPSGRIHHVPDYGHCKKAVELGDETGGRRLEREGWAHCSLGSIVILRNPTQAQIDALYDFVDSWVDAAMNNPACAYRARDYQEELMIVISRCE